MTEKQVFGPLELPSGKTVKFREPVGADRVNVIQMLKMSMDNMAGSTLLIEGYVAAKCVTEYDGKAAEGNYKALIDTMPQMDLDYYQGVFAEMFGMTEEKRSSMKDAASFLRKGQTFTASCK